MPGMDGYEVARRIRLQAGMENVVFTAVFGWAPLEDCRSTREAGFNHHLVQPAELNRVESVLTELKRPDAR
jgi:CheY-like chemotaxis protein